MISSVGGGNVLQSRALQQEPPTSGLAAKRAQEGHQMVRATIAAQHQERVRLAVDAYMQFQARDAAPSTTSLAAAQQAYDEV